jgi:hypothetical protein
MPLLPRDRRRDRWNARHCWPLSHELNGPTWTRAHQVLWGGASPSYRAVRASRPECKINYRQTLRLGQRFWGSTSAPAKGLDSRSIEHPLPLAHKIARLWTFKPSELVGGPGEHCRRMGKTERHETNVQRHESDVKDRGSRAALKAANANCS